MDSAFFCPAYSAYLSQVIEADKLLAANGLGGAARRCSVASSSERSSPPSVTPPSPPVRRSSGGRYQRKRTESHHSDLCVSEDAVNIPALRRDR